jgi:hypothetical protein
MWLVSVVCGTLAFWHSPTCLFGFVECGVLHLLEPSGNSSWFVKVFSWEPLSNCRRFFSCPKLSLSAIQCLTTVLPPNPLTILITGASAGIGRITCRLLAKQKHRFILAARSKDKLSELEAELRAEGVESLAVPTDVSNPRALESLVKAGVDRFGRIDVLINNAGIECFATLDELPVEDILQTIETNLTGAILLTRFVVPVMRQNGFGRIINISSIAGKHGPATARSMVRQRPD